MLSPKTVTIPNQPTNAYPFTTGGKYGSDGQFLGYLWMGYVVVHRFDSTGVYRATDYELLEIEELGRQTLKAKIAALGNAQVCDIHLQPFKMKIGEFTHAIFCTREPVYGEENDVWNFINIIA